MSDQVTLATSSGLPFLSLAFHVGMGALALAAGFMAVAARKGGTWHRRTGVVFVWTMIATGITGAAVAMYEGKSTVTGGVLAAYLVFTAFITVRPLPGVGRRADIALLMVALAITTYSYVIAFTALGTPGKHVDGVPAGMLFFMATIVLLAAIGDVRMIRAGALSGTRRLARHLWRMCFGLFIASGSFFLGQMQFVPEPIRIVPLLVALGVAPLVVLLYWMWRVRLKQNVRGIMQHRYRPINLPTNT